MRKILSMVLAVMMLAGCALAFSACGAKPELNFETAKANLEADGYTCTYSTSISVFESEQFNAVTFDENGEQADFITISVYTDTKTAKLRYKDAKQLIKSEIESIENQIKWNEALLDEYTSQIDETKYNELKDEITYLEYELSQLETYVVGRSGKTVWIGTEKAIDASKA